MTRSMQTAAAVVAALVWRAPGASAGGILVPGTGPQAQGRAGAFAAKADDPSALYHNPAGLAKTPGTVLYIGGNLLDYRLRFARAGRYEVTDGGESYVGADYPVVEDDSTPDIGVGPFQAVPIVAVSTDLGRPEWPVRFGAGLLAPQGHPNRSFPVRHDLGGADPAPGPQRYDVIEQSAATALPSIGVAYRPIDSVDVGVRASWGIAQLQATTATWAIRNYEEWEQKDGVFSVDVADSFVPAWGIGVLYRPIGAIELGASYHSALHIRATGTGTADLGTAADPLDPNAFIEPEDRPEFIDCALGGTVDALKSCIDFDLPQMASIGARWIARDGEGRERGDVELDVRWENWGADDASNIRVRVDGRSSTGGFVLNPVVLRHGFRDVWSIRLGGSYAVPVAGRRVTVRAGVAHDTETAPLLYNRADIDGAPRTTMAIGASFPVGDRVQLDVGGGYVVEPTRDVPQCLPPDGPDASNPTCDGQALPPFDRRRPDPAQPLNDANSAVESPFNAGRYEASYVMWSLGVSARF